MRLVQHVILASLLALSMHTQAEFTPEFSTVENWRFVVIHGYSLG